MFKYAKGAFKFIKKNWKGVCSHALIPAIIYSIFILPTSAFDYIIAHLGDFNNANFWDIFTSINDLPISGSNIYNRLWSNNNSAYFIAELDITNISKITKIGISTWGNNFYPTENVFIYASNTYNGEYIELGNIYVNTKAIGIYKMGYVNVDYTINIKKSSEIIKNKVINTIINHPLIKYLILQEKE